MNYYFDAPKETANPKWKLVRKFAYIGRYQSNIRLYENLIKNQQDNVNINRNSTVKIQ